MDLPSVYALPSVGVEGPAWAATRRLEPEAWSLAASGPLRSLHWALGLSYIGLEEFASLGMTENTPEIFSSTYLAHRDILYC